MGLLPPTPVSGALPALALNRRASIDWLVASASYRGADNALRDAELRSGQAALPALGRLERKLVKWIAIHRLRGVM